MSDYDLYSTLAAAFGVFLLLTLGPVVAWCTVGVTRWAVGVVREAWAATDPARLRDVAAGTDPVRLEQMLAIAEAEEAWDRDVWAYVSNDDEPMRVIIPGPAAEDEGRSA